MTEEIAKTASELLKEKSNLLDDLSKICDKPKENSNKSWKTYDDYYFLTLSYGYSGGFYFGANPSLNVNKYTEIKQKIKHLLILKINNKIQEIDNKLKKLSCE